MTNPHDDFYERLSKLDRTRWGKLVPPAQPVEEDVQFYKDHMLSGTTLVLGVTPELVPLCDACIDLYPYKENDKLIVGNWVDNKTFYNNIIGDGILNFTKELDEQILDMASKNSEIFISRVFSNYKEFAIAKYFPEADDFHIKPDISVKRGVATFHVWNFKK